MGIAIFSVLLNTSFKMIKSESDVYLLIYILDPDYYC